MRGNVVGPDDQRKISKISTKDFASVITEQCHGQQISFACLFQRDDDIFRSAAGGDGDRNIVRTRLRDQLALKNQFRADIIGDSRKIGGLHGK